LALAGLVLSGRAMAADVTLKALFMKQAAYSEDNIRDMTTAFEQAHPGTKVDLEFVAYEALHDKIVAASGANSAYDVVLFDVIWPAEFGHNGLLVDVTKRIPAAENDQIFDGAWSTVTWNGRRWGMPWILDTKYLFYNTDMLAKAGIAAPPKTWQELADDAKILKDKGIVQYPIAWSWSQAEALICAYTTLLAAFGGEFFHDGKPAFQQGGGLDALNYMVDTLKAGLSNPHSKEFLEDDVRRVFSSGEAAFALNWTYMYATANDPQQSQIAGKVGIAPAPGVAGKSEYSAMNGSMALGIPTNSTHQDQAWQYIEYLTSQPVQNQYAKLSLPIWKSSYDDPKVAEGQEALVKAAKISLNIMYPRPLIINSQELSSILQKDIQEALLGSMSPADALQDAAKKAARLR
jgi:multiple sugar transport system substrate-binding protein